MLVRLSGELDIAVQEELRTQLNAAAAASDIVEIDLSGVTYADSTALGIFIALRNKLLARGGTVRLISPSARVTKLLGYAGLDRVFEISDTPVS
jgi:anti-sigma B factor antagonist